MAGKSTDSRWRIRTNGQELASRLPRSAPLNTLSPFGAVLHALDRRALRPSMSSRCEKMTAMGPWLFPRVYTTTDEHAAGRELARLGWTMAIGASIGICPDDQTPPTDLGEIEAGHIL
jgi:hypothetical protein